MFTAFSLYDFKKDITKQTAVAYTSTIITFIFLVGVIIYDMYLLVRKNQPQGEEVNEYLLAPIQHAEVTQSVVEVHDHFPPPEDNNVQIEVKEIICTETTVYQ